MMSEFSHEPLGRAIAAVEEEEEEEEEAGVILNIKSNKTDEQTKRP
jgi:hypothetical protein